MARYFFIKFFHFFSKKGLTIYKNMLNYVSEINEIAPPDPGGFPSLFSRRDLFLSSFSKINPFFHLNFICQKHTFYVRSKNNLFYEVIYNCLKCKNLSVNIPRKIKKNPAGKKKKCVLIKSGCKIFV